MKQLKRLLLLMLVFMAACGTSTETTTPAEEIETDQVPTTAAAEEAPSSEAEASAEDGALTVLDLDIFDPAALVQAPTVVDCTLTNSTETECAQIVVKYLPDTLQIGPFCPDNIYEDIGGIWEWDGDNPATYRLNEAFFTMLTDQGFNFYDAAGNVYIGDPAGGLIADVNNCLEATADVTVEMTAVIPLQPVMADSLTQLGTVAQVGLAIDGVPIFADAPSVLDRGHLPALDTCGGHIDPGGWYHWHATSTDIESSYEHEGVDADCHLEQDPSALFAYAFDGYPIYGSSEPDGSIPADLDECGGHVGPTAEFPDGIYHYHASLEFPNLPTCLVGLSANNAFATTASNGIGAGGGGQGGRPDFAAAAEILGISEDALREALGDPPPDFEAAAATLGISAQELQEALGVGGPPSEGQDNQGPPEGEGAAPAEEPAAAAMVDDNVANIGTGRLFTLPGGNIFPEGVSYSPIDGKFYVGATSNGTLYVGDVNGEDEMTVFSEGGADGRTAAIGTKVDAEGRLWVAGGGTGQVFVYDTADGSFIASFTTPASDATFINDIAITDDGIYFTDSFRPILWRVTDLAQGEAEAWLDFTGTAINYVAGFNLNGIVATEDGSSLIVVHSGEGELYHIDVESQAVTRIDTGTVGLTAGDGLALVGNTIYVTRNSFGEIVELELSADLTSGTGGTIITSDLFGYPTTIAFTGNTFLVANSQFNNRGEPNLPFTIAQIPVSK